MKKAMTRIFLAMLTVFFLASSAFAGVSGDVSISVILKGTEPPSRCLLKQKAVKIFSNARISTTQYDSTVYICSEANCDDIEVELGGVWHDSYLTCGNNLSFVNMPSGSYDMYAESSNCNTYWEYNFFLEEGSDYLIWLCPPEGGTCCSQGCADGGGYNCDACSGGCFAASVTSDKTVLSNLRQFRDYLAAKNFIGQKIVTLYYKVSPTAIKIVNKFPFLKSMSKKILETIAK